MEETNPNEIGLVKVFACWGEEVILRQPLALGEAPQLIYQLSTAHGEPHRKLLKRLEMLADILPYITQAEEQASRIQENFQYSTTVENLKMAIKLGNFTKEVAVDLAIQEMEKGQT